MIFQELRQIRVFADTHGRACWRAFHCGLALSDGGFGSVSTKVPHPRFSMPKASPRKSFERDTPALIHERYLLASVGA